MKKKVNMKIGLRKGDYYKIKLIAGRAKLKQLKTEE